MSLDEMCRRRKPALKTLFPWPGFFLLDQNLPDRLLGFQAEGFCPLQIPGQGPWGGRSIQFRRNGIVHTPFPIQIGPQQCYNHQGAKRSVGEHIRCSCAHRAPTAQAKPAVSPDLNRSQHKVPHGLHPSPVPAMGMKRPRAAEAFVAHTGPLRSTAIGPLMPKKQIGNEYQPILKTRYQTHETTPCPRFSYRYFFQMSGNPKREERCDYREEKLRRDTKATVTIGAATTTGTSWSVSISSVAGSVFSWWTWIQVEGGRSNSARVNA
jgi:hypothetical protein